jgi:hypothetical protein
MTDYGKSGTHKTARDATRQKDPGKAPAAPKGSTKANPRPPASKDELVARMKARARAPGDDTPH